MELHRLLQLFDRKWRLLTQSTLRIT